MKRFIAGEWVDPAKPSTRPGESPDIVWNEQKPGKFNLAALPWMYPLLKSRWPLFLARAFTLAGFVFTILVGLLGSPVGSHNFAIIFVWLAWWTALKLVFIPLGGRSWCSVCPLPMPGEWLQQGGILQKAARPFGLSRRWPKRLRGYWLQAGAFLLIGVFSALTLTNARLTAWILLGLIGLAVVLSLVFERRAFCSHVCPIGGFTGLYAQTAPIEVRVVDKQVCKAHGDKTCYTHCPWGVYPVALKDNAACGLCMECLRVCPQDNIALNLRPFGHDLTRSSQPKYRLDETFLALVMLGSALVFSAVFLGPWGTLKNAAYRVGSADWWLYAAGFLVVNLILLPAAFAIACWGSAQLAGKKVALKKAIADNTTALLPLGLFAWIAFTIAFAIPKFHYVLAVLSDPFGWGWGLLAGFGLDGVFPFRTSLMVLFILAGMFSSARISGHATVGIRRISALPVTFFCFAYSLTLLWLLVA